MIEVQVSRRYHPDFWTRLGFLNFQAAFDVKFCEQKNLSIDASNSATTHPAILSLKLKSWCKQKKMIKNYYEIICLLINNSK